MRIAYKEIPESNVSFLLSCFLQVTKKITKPTLPTVCLCPLAKEQQAISSPMNLEHQLNHWNRQRAMTTSISSALATQWSWPNNHVAPGSCCKGRETKWTSYVVVAGPSRTDVLPGHFMQGHRYVSTHDCLLAHPVSNRKADDTSRPVVHISSIPKQSIPGLCRALCF